MDVHQNARTTLHGRCLMIRRLADGWTVAEVAAAFGVTLNTVRKWRDRHASDGAPGLVDRSSRPHHSPTRLNDAAADEIEQLRRQRLSAPAIARKLGRPVSTVGLVLRRRGLGRLAALDPRLEPIRYQRDRPGELIHLDVKKLGNITASDTASPVIEPPQPRRRLGFPRHLCRRCLPPGLHGNPRRRAQGERGGVPRAGLGLSGQLGVAVERVMTDNGSAYRSHHFRQAIVAAGLKHKRTRPYTPRTNGKAERFIQTSLREWAYLQAFASSTERAQAMRPWLHAYNRHRPHSALGRYSVQSAPQAQPPWKRQLGHPDTPRCH